MDFNFKMIFNTGIALLILFVLYLLITKRKLNLSTGEQTVQFAGSPVANAIGYTG